MRALLGICCALAACASASREVVTVERYRFEHTAMGTSWSLVIYAPDQSRARDAAAAAFALVDEVDCVASDYDPTSELAGLEGASSGEWVEVSPLLADLLEEARALAAATDGAFDPTMGRATKLWRRARRQAELPTEERVELALRSIGWESLHVAPATSRVRLERDGARLDLGGVAKGQALDRALDVLRDHGLTSALLEGGGDLRAGDPPPGAEHWVVAIEGGARRVALRNAGMATSGDTYRGFEVDGVHYAHLLDPRTARPARAGRSATVIAATAAEADAFASACCVAEVETARAWFGPESRRAALLGDRDGGSPSVMGDWARYEIAGAGGREP